MNKTLWLSDSASLEAEKSQVNIFTTGMDRELDIQLAAADVRASLTHTQMLYSVGLISEQDWNLVRPALQQIAEEIAAGNFEISEGVEDVHSQVELLLTSRIGEAGKKIHTGRSRNDQVLTDLKIFFRDQVITIAAGMSEVFHKLTALSDKHRDKLMPGYTHFQVAMPSSFGLWFGAYAESLCDDLEYLQAAYRICNRNPLGSGAGFGSPFPLDRDMTTELLAFSGMNVNAVYAQMTRGKTEKILSSAMASVAHTLSRFSYDVCLYMGQDFGFISFPAELCTGSSIMPHKKNPDVFELIRARCNRLQSVPNELTLLTTNLPSGYHRDLQLTKEIIFPAIKNLKECLSILSMMLDHICVADDLLKDEKYDLLFTVEEVNRLVMEGQTFRDAYNTVSKAVNSGTYVPRRDINHSHVGSINKTGTDRVRQRFNELMNSFS